MPLSKPITTTSGKVVYEIPVPKGLKIITSICGYNRFVFFMGTKTIMSSDYSIRDRDLFGEDSHSFKPERWLTSSRERKGPSVGVYSNLYVSYHPAIRILSDLHAQIEFCRRPEVLHRLALCVSINIYAIFPQELTAVTHPTACLNYKPSLWNLSVISSSALRKTLARSGGRHA